MVIWTDGARRDLDEIHAYIAREASPGIATKVAASIAQAARLLDQFKGLGRATDIENIREYVVPRYRSYIIGYTVRGQDTLILRIRHARQNR